MLELAQSALELVVKERQEKYRQALIREMPEVDWTALKISSAMAIVPNPVSDGPSPGRGFQLPEPLDHEQARRLLTALVAHVCEIEQSVWGVWTQWAPQSAIKQPREVRSLIQRYLTESSDGAPIQISEGLDATKRLLSGLLLAINASIHNYAVNYWQTFSPSEIATSALIEQRSSLLKRLHSLPTMSWRKYEQLFESRSTNSMESQIKDVVVATTTELMIKHHSAAALGGAPS
ncbi:MAG TPA: hypothetical protein VNU68_04155 [Verrucomicrobiae bacterium]|nr:hypothetical protein [Verrucomicrobiae bacterium]